MAAPIWCVSSFSPPTAVCLLSFNVSLQSVLHVTAAGALLLPLPPGCALLKLRAGRWGNCEVIRALQCCISTWEIKIFRKFLSCLKRGISLLPNWLDLWEIFACWCIYSPMLLAVLLTGAERRFIESANICQTGGNIWGLFRCDCFSSSLILVLVW